MTYAKPSHKIKYFEQVQEILVLIPYAPKLESSDEPEHPSTFVRVFTACMHKEWKWTKA